jgi:hypothetical protein
MPEWPLDPNTSIVRSRRSFAFGAKSCHKLFTLINSTKTLLIGKELNITN